MNSFVKKVNGFRALALLGGIGLLAVVYSCTPSSGTPGMMGGAAPSLPVLTVANVDATTYREFPALLEGKVNVEIRPQVDGYLDAVYVDEGAYVKAGQPLFRINDQLYREQQANANAALQAAEANFDKAQLEVDRLAPLVKNNVVSDIQLKTAESGLAAAKANVAQAKAAAGNARINVGYTIIKAPVSGYIGHLNYRIGSLVGRGEEQPLTVLSEIQEIYAYFSMSEVDFLEFKQQVAGNTLEDKIHNVPPVELLLADDSRYAEKGKIEAVEGQFDRTTGAINFRATYPNASGLLRSGNTGRVLVPKHHKNTVVIPQDATFELQDKVLVFVVADSNKVVSRPITVADKSSQYYFVKDGLRAGEKIVYTGLSRLRDGAVVVPQPITLDSLLKATPL